MKNILHIILILIAVILQLTLLPHLAIFGSKLNLILVVFLTLVFCSRFAWALWWVSLGGILLDLTSTFYFGLYTLDLLILLILSTYLVFKIFHSPNIFVAFGFFFVFSILFDLIFCALASTSFNSLIFASGLYNSLIGLLIFYFVKRNLKVEEKIKI